MSVLDATPRLALRQAAAERQADELTRLYGELPAKALLETMIRRAFPGRIAVVSAFGAESAVLLDLVAAIDPATPVIFLDTGKHFAETLAYRDRLATRLGLSDLRVVTPDEAVIARQDRDGRLWSHSPDFCCHLRKVVPLTRALSGFQAWITGRKRFHGDSRTFLEPIEAVDGRVKINPLAHWSLREIGEAFAARDLPRHPLAARGYASIGCAPCTRAVDDGESPRAGRWADREKSECGIHRSPAVAAAAPQNP